MKVVVAGGRGALGRRLVVDLSGRGHEVVAALGLTGRRVVPSRLLDAGFTFRYPRLEPALRDLLPRR